MPLFLKFTKSLILIPTMKCTRLSGNTLIIKSVNISAVLIAVKSQSVLKVLAERKVPSTSLNPGIAKC